MRGRVNAMWLYGYGNDCIDPLVNPQPEDPPVESVCLDKDPIAEAILRLALNEKNIIPSEDLKIHCWKTTHSDGALYYFMDDEQNNLLKAQHQTACNL